jgi:hypothetical protein
MPTLEQVQQKVRSRFPTAKTVRKLEWQQISKLVIRADDYEIHKSGLPGHFVYSLFKLPFHELLHGPCDNAQEAMDAASLHQVLL